MLQGKVVRPVTKGSYAIHRHLHLITTVPGISHGMQHTNIGTHPTNNQPLRLKPAQLLVKEGIKKGAVMPFRYYLTLVLGQLWNDLRLGSALKAMGRKYFELRVIRGVTVTKEEYLRPLANLLLQKGFNIGDDTTDSSPTIQGVTLLQETPNHVYY